MYRHGLPRSLLAGGTILVVLTASLTLVYALTSQSSDLGEFRPLDMQIDGGEAITVPVEELVSPMETLVATAILEVVRDLNNGETPTGIGGTATPTWSGFYTRTPTRTPKEDTSGPPGPTSTSNGTQEPSVTPEPGATDTVPAPTNTPEPPPPTDPPPTVPPPPEPTVKPDKCKPDKPPGHPLYCTPIP
jgi:hypothetical protein